MKEIETDVLPDSRESLPTRASRRSKKHYDLSEEDELLVAMLPPHYGEMLRQNGSMTEIAARLQLPVGTVKSRTHRARAALDQLAAREKTTH